MAGFSPGRMAGFSPGRTAGFSLIEVLIAAGILLLVFLGVVPMFTQAMMSNQTGGDLTQISNISKSQVEELYQLPFGHPDLTIPGGSTELATVAYWDPATQRFIATPPATGSARWTLNTTVRQYSLSDLTNNGVLDTPLDGDATPAFVQLKEIEVQVVSESGIVGADRQILLRVLKAI
jgi:hypothetical protein